MSKFSPPGLTKKQAKALLKRFTNYLSVQVVLEMPRYVDNFMQEIYEEEDHIEHEENLVPSKPVEVTNNTWTNTPNDQVTDDTNAVQVRNQDDHQIEPNQWHVSSQLVRKVESETIPLSLRQYDSLVENIISAASMRKSETRQKEKERINPPSEESSEEDGYSEEHRRTSLHSRLDTESSLRSTRFQSNKRYSNFSRYCSICDKNTHNTWQCWNRKRKRYD